MRKLLFLQLYLLIIVALLHILGTWLSLYWMFWWYDILVHFLASAWLAVLASWTSLSWQIQPRVSFVIGCVLLVSVAWELFEYEIGATHAGEMMLDTILDVAINIGGGFVGLFLAKRSQSTATI